MTQPTLNIFIPPGWDGMLCLPIAGYPLKYFRLSLLTVTQFILLVLEIRALHKSCQRTKQHVPSQHSNMDPDLESCLVAITPLLTYALYIK